MLISKDIQVLPIFPSEASTRTLVFTVLTSTDSSVAGYIVDKLVLVLNIISIVVVFVADTNLPESEIGSIPKSSSYVSLYNGVTKLGVIDLCVFLCFWVIFLLKLFTASGLNLDELEVEKKNKFFPKLPDYLRKALAFLKMPIEFIDLIMLLIYAILFLPIKGIMDNFTLCLYLSFYTRCIKLAIYSRGWRTFFKILYRGRQPMVELSSLIAILTLTLGFSAYLSEKYLKKNKEEQTVNKSRDFKNMLDGIWWAIVTITSTGYGDYYTVTILGRVISTVTMIVGFLYVAMPISIINNFYERYLIEEEERMKLWRSQMRSRLEDFIDAKKNVRPKKKRKLPISRIFEKQNEKIEETEKSKENSEHLEESERFQIVKKRPSGKSELSNIEGSRCFDLETLLERTENLICKQEEAMEEMKNLREYALNQLEIEKSQSQ